MTTTHYLTTPVRYFDDRPQASGASITIPAGVAVEFDGRAPSGMARIFLPAIVIGGGLRKLPMVVVPFNAIEAL